MVDALACLHGGEGFNSLLWYHGHALKPTNGLHALGGLQVAHMPKPYKWPMCQVKEGLT